MSASRAQLRRILRTGIRLLSSAVAQSKRAPAPGNRPGHTDPSSDHTDPSWGQTDPSPGQFGPGATRDATPEEIAKVNFAYQPDPDGDPDPGEVVWTWVPFQEHDGRGKDRPVLVIGRLEDDAVAVCYLSTHHHDGYVSVGSGPWDSKQRESFLNPMRILRVTAAGMRREASMMPRAAFERCVTAITQQLRRR